MLFARWQHHLWFLQQFSLCPIEAMVTKISKWSRIQDSFRITPKIELLLDCAIPYIPSKFQKDPFITFWVILHTDKQTDRQTNKVWQKHYLLGGGNYVPYPLHLVNSLPCFITPIISTDKNCSGTTNSSLKCTSVGLCASRYVQWYQNIFACCDTQNLSRKRRKRKERKW